MSGPTDGPAYVDLDRPPLHERGLSAALTRTAPWTSLRVLQSATSTNDVLAAAARDGAADGSVVVAEVQTGGRGRLGRTWVSPPRAGLTFSMLLRPEVDVARRSWLPLLVAVGDALAAHCELAGVGLKWPNDVLVGDRKVAGILAEVVGDAVIIGVGLNVTTTRDELPRPDATSLALEAAARTDRGPLLLAILRAVGTYYATWLAQPDDAEIADAYRARCRTLGRNVTVDLPGGEQLMGQATDVDATGRLVVSGRALSAGDVTHVRSQPT